MYRKGLTKANYDHKINHYANLEFNHQMRRGQFKPKQVCRREAERKVEDLYFIVDHKSQEGQNEYAYLSDKAVENGEGSIFINGRIINIM